MKTKLNIVIALIVCFLSDLLFSYHAFSERFCNDPNYTCRKIDRGDSWSDLFPDVKQRDLVKRINRTNIFLHPDMIIAIPKSIEQLTLNDASPFPLLMTSNREKTIYVDQKQLAWGAYDESGHLVRWGPISPGSNPCPDGTDGCLTPIGTFRIIKKKGENCVSKTYPQRLSGQRGGGEMPYCLHFFHGFALHGSSELPGYPASFGCVRLFINDAKWLNEEFAHTQSKNTEGTRVIIMNSA